jgi:uncharacterized protein (TIGR03067 family)
MKRLVIIVLALGLTASTLAPAAPRPKEDKDDLAKLEGSWTFTSWEHFGQALPNEARATAKWTVKGDKYTFEIQGVTEEGIIKLDRDKKPFAFDLIIKEGADKGKTQLGIYKIDGDTVTFCLARPGVADRPKEFITTAENGQILVTIKRAKKDE